MNATTKPDRTLVARVHAAFPGTATGPKSTEIETARAIRKHLDRACATGAAPIGGIVGGRLFKLTIEDQGADE